LYSREDDDESSSTLSPPPAMTVAQKLGWRWADVQRRLLVGQLRLLLAALIGGMEKRMVSRRQSSSRGMVLFDVDGKGKRSPLLDG